MRPTILFIATLLAACSASTGQKGPAGPTGPQGPQGVPGPQGDAGPTGGGLYTSRTQIVCKGIQGLFVADGGVVASGGGASGTMQVRCDDENDLPLTGSCEGSVPSDTALVGNVPDTWMASAADLDAGVLPAGWMCSWVITGTVHDLPNVQGQMCCIKNH